MKINELSVTTEGAVTDYVRSVPRAVTSHIAAVPRVISGMWGDEKGRENATERIARGKFVNTFTNKFLSLLNTKVNQLKVNAASASQQAPQQAPQQAAQAPTTNYGKGGAGVPNVTATPTAKVSESLDNKLAILLTEQQSQIPIATTVRQMVDSYMTGYPLTNIDAAINQFCQNIADAYASNRSPVGELRKLGDLLFSEIMIQKKASQPKQVSSPADPNQLDSESQKAINLIKSLSTDNNTYAVTIASMKQLRKVDPAAYAKLVASL